MSIIKSNMTAPPPAASGGGGGNASLSSIGEMTSLRFDGSSYLSRNFNLVSNTYTFSAWVKRSSDTDKNTIISSQVANPNVYPDLSFTGGTMSDTGKHHKLCYYDSFNGANNLSTGVYRDFSAWYHIVMTWDAYEQKVYVNGDPTPVISSGGKFNFSSKGAYIGRSYSYVSGEEDYFNGYMSDLHFIDGQALTPHYFGANVSGTWVPKAFDGTSSDSTYDVSGASFTYGSSGFHLDFSTIGGRTVSNMGWVQTSTAGSLPNGISASSTFIETAVPTNLSPTNEAIAFVNDGYLQVSPFVPMSGDFTLELWISRKSSITIPQDLFLFSDGSQFYMENGVISWWDNTANRTFFAYSTTDSSWEHIALVRENGFVECYKNGVSSGGYGGSDSRTIGGDWVKIGTRLQGGVNHIRISNSARYSGTSIADWQNTTHSFTPDENTLLLITDQNNIDYMTFVDKSGSGGIDIGYDSSGNNNHWEVY